MAQLAVDSDVSALNRPPDGWDGNSQEGRSLRDLDG